MTICPESSRRVFLFFERAAKAKMNQSSHGKWFFLNSKTKSALPLQGLNRMLENSTTHLNQDNHQ